MPLTSAGALNWVIEFFSDDRTLAVSDAFKYLILTGATARTVTIPPNSDVNFSDGVQLSFKQQGTGLLTMAPGVGVTIQSRGSLLDANGQFAVFSIIQDSEDVWSLFGDLA